MMEKDKIREVVKKAVMDSVRRVDGLDGHEFDDSDVLKDYPMDSLDVMETILRIETRLNIYVPNKKIHDIHTFGDLCRLIEESAV
jgi:acyl carrier protein